MTYFTGGFRSSDVSRNGRRYTNAPRYFASSKLFIAHDAVTAEPDRDSEDSRHKSKQRCAAGVRVFFSEWDFRSKKMQSFDTYALKTLEFSLFQNIWLP